MTNVFHFSKNRPIKRFVTLLNKQRFDSVASICLCRIHCHADGQGRAWPHFSWMSSWLELGWWMETPNEWFAWMPDWLRAHGLYLTECAWFVFDRMRKTWSRLVSVMKSQRLWCWILFWLYPAKCFTRT
jgi:hypothetical protein